MHIPDTCTLICSISIAPTYPIHSIHVTETVPPTQSTASTPTTVTAPPSWSCDFEGLDKWCRATPSPRGGARFIVATQTLSSTTGPSGGNNGSGIQCLATPYI